MSLLNESIPTALCCYHHVEMLLVLLVTVLLIGPNFCFCLLPHACYVPTWLRAFELSNSHVTMGLVAVCLVNALFARPVSLGGFPCLDRFADSTHFRNLMCKDC
ncbi:hypothetical protein ILYODFUR_017608 [Ilyodon furcidens]|uniref:Uncharacterized protein n=1 Tax=Ilyodon furcidens TaxID=33524 RepID=A0ABV0T8W4_9TELE